MILADRFERIMQGVPGIIYSVLWIGAGLGYFFSTAPPYFERGVVGLPMNYLPLEFQTPLVFAIGVSVISATLVVFGIPLYAGVLNLLRAVDNLGNKSVSGS